VKVAAYSFDTEVVHGGEGLPVSPGLPSLTPIYASSTYRYSQMSEMDAVFGGEQQGYVYQRYGNPTLTALEVVLARLDNGSDAVVFSSGMAALHAALLLCELQAGDTVLLARSTYGATLGLLNQIFGPLGVAVRLADFSDHAALEAALQQQPLPRVALFEPLSNPLLQVADVYTVSKLAHSVGATVIADNTFASPYVLQPLDLGADIVVHSATKFLSGHGDVTGGVVVVKDAERATALRTISKLVGAILSPFDAHLIHRGVKTLALRMERQCQNALAVARWLSQQPAIAVVNYPGLAGHPQHALASVQLCRGQFGAIMSFEVKGGDKAAVFRFMDALKLIIPVTTLGDVYSEVLYPPMSSHRDWSPKQRQQAGIGEGLVRLSVGIEHIDDILADLKQALAAIG